MCNRLVELRMKKIFENKKQILQSPFLWALFALIIRYVFKYYVFSLQEFLVLIIIPILYCITNKTLLTKKFIIRFSIFYPLLYFATFLITAGISIYKVHNYNLVIQNMPNILNVLQMTLFQSICWFIVLNILLWSVYLCLNIKTFFNTISSKISGFNLNINPFFDKTFSFLKNKTFVTLIITIFSIFILLNLLIFGSVVSRESKGNINKEARIYLASAYAINKVYIFPLSNTFGFLSPVTKPFYMVRNFLYKKGMDKLAPADGEREWWWFRIREQEFVNLYMKAMFDWNEKNVLPKNKADELIKMEDEVYSNLLNIPNAEPYDKSLAKEKYLMFIETGYRYATYFSYLPYEYKKYYKTDYTNRQIKHFENFYNDYLKYKNYAYKKERDSISYIQKDAKLVNREPEFKSELLYNLLLSLYKKNRLSCECKYYQPLAQTQLYLLNYLTLNKSYLSFDEAQELRNQIDPFINSKVFRAQCQNSNTFKYYEKFIKLRYEYDHKK